MAPADGMTQKVLCLHGYSMNSAWLREWCLPLEQALAGELEFIYPQGPIECPEAEVRATTALFNMPLPEARIGPGLNWCWYRVSEERPPVYHGIETSLAMLAELFEREGPVAGVLGWSQGTVMAATLAALMSRDADSPFQFRWAVLCGGFIPGDVRYRDLFQAQLSLPTLHVLGTKESDFMKRQGERLLHAFTGSERLDTPVGHIMPLKHRASMTALAEWMRGQLRRSVG